MEEFVEKHSETPNVHFVGMSVFIDYFGTHVLEGAAHSSPVVFFVEITTPAEVTELHMEVLVQDDVFRLDVSVDYVPVVQILDCRGHLIEELESNGLGESFFGVDVEEETSVTSVFEQQKEQVSFLVGVVEVDDGRMFQILVELNFLLEIS